MKGDWVYRSRNDWLTLPMPCNNDVASHCMACHGANMCILDTRSCEPDAAGVLLWSISCSGMQPRPTSWPAARCMTGAGMPKPSRSGGDGWLLNRGISGVCWSTSVPNLQDAADTCRLQQSSVLITMQSRVMQILTIHIAERLTVLAVGCVLAS